MTNNPTVEALVRENQEILDKIEELVKQIYRAHPSKRSKWSRDRCTEILSIIESGRGKPVEPVLDLEYYHVCDRDGEKEPVIREYGTLVCSMCRPHTNSVNFLTTKDEFEKLKSKFQITRKPVMDKVAVMQKVMDEWTDEERYDVINHYCTHCGSKDTNCQCWNDE